MFAAGSYDKERLNAETLDKTELDIFEEVLGLYEKVRDDVNRAMRSAEQASGGTLTKMPRGSVKGMVYTCVLPQYLQPSFVFCVCVFLCECVCTCSCVRGRGWGWMLAAGPPAVVRTRSSQRAFIFLNFCLTTGLWLRARSPSRWRSTTTRS